jgi:ATP-dependent DNA helicase PIF1
MSTIYDGNNVVISGAAGTGKSYAVANIVKSLKSAAIPFGVTASTGTAAYIINGRTLHSYLGIGLGKAPVGELVSKAKSAIRLKLRLLHVLIIDEISMIDAALFEKVSLYMQTIRKCDAPFGGVQMILVGDFAQIPPVNGQYCFKSPEWTRANLQKIILTENRRQQNDMELQQILGEARMGRISPESVEKLESRRKLKRCGNMEPTILFAKNIDVDTINEKRYTKLIKDTNPKRRVYGELDICVGAQVVLTWNMDADHGLVNGSRGVVVDLAATGPIVQFRSGLTRTVNPVPLIDNKIPIKLAYALTIHKSQGMTIDYMIVDLGPTIFEYGQAYTALSRARDLESLAIVAVCQESFKTHKDVVEFYSV